MTNPAPPPWAVLAWADHANVYLELPRTEGGWYRMTFPLSESGLSRALHLLKERPQKGEPLTRPDPTPPALRDLAKRIAAYA